MKTDPPLDRLSDAALLVRFATLRDEVAFAQLMTRHGPMVLATCLRMLADRQDAEDAFQAVFVTLSARARALRRMRSLAGWLHNVAVRVSYGVLRSNRRRQKQLLAIQDRRVESKEDRLAVLREVLDEELTALPARYREAVVLCDLEGYTREDAALKLAVPAGTIASRLVRGRKRLRDRLVRRGVTVGAGGLSAVFSRWAEAAPQVSAELAALTVRHCELFLVGKSATVPPAAAKIGSLAQGVIHSMFLTKMSTTVCIVALAAALVLGASGHGPWARAAEIPFVDDFADGSATDGSPATWTPISGFNTGTFSAATGDYVVTQPPDGWPQAVIPNMTPIGPISIRAQVRELQGSGPISLIGRLSTAGAPSGYQAGIDSGGLYIVRTNSPFDNSDLASANTNLNPTVEDVILQFDIIGSQLNLFAWRAGEGKPSSPNLSAIDSTFATGVAGILVDSEASHSVAFRSIHVANSPIPEPSTAALGSLGVVAIASLIFRNRLTRVRQQR